MYLNIASLFAYVRMYDFSLSACRLVCWNEKYGKPKSNQSPNRLPFLFLRMILLKMLFFSHSQNYFRSFFFTVTWKHRSIKTIKLILLWLCDKYFNSSCGTTLHVAKIISDFTKLIFFFRFWYGLSSHLITIIYFLKIFHLFNKSTTTMTL